MKYEKPLFALDPLDRNLVLSKPLQQEAFDMKTVEELEKAGRLMITRKRDGWKLIVVKYKNKIKIYTDGSNEITDKLPNIAYELRRLSLANRTVLVGEGLVENDGRDNFQKANSVFHLKRIAERDLWQEIDKMRLVLFDIVLYAGKPLCELVSYAARWRWLDTKVKAMFNWRNSMRRLRRGRLPHHENLRRRYIDVVELLHCPLAEAQKIALEKGWEGLVLYDQEFRLSFRTDGKSPQRLKGCYKWKPIYEDDFIVRRWNRCDDDPGRLKDVNLLQIDPITKKEFDCGKLGGFSEEMRYKIMVARKPLVLQVKYEQRFPSGKLRNARLMRIRCDKRVEDCLASQSYNPT